MILTETSTQKIVKPRSISCDECKDILVYDNDKNIIEDSFLFIRKDYGYHSKKDGAGLSIDLCEHCTQKLLGHLFK